MSPELSSSKADLQKPNLAWNRSCSSTEHLPLGQPEMLNMLEADCEKAVPQGLQLWTRRCSSGFHSVQPLPCRHSLCMWKQKPLAEISLGEAEDLVSSALLSSRSLDGNKPPCSAELKCWTSTGPGYAKGQTHSLQTLTSSTFHCHR